VSKVKKVETGTTVREAGEVKEASTVSEAKEVRTAKTEKYLNSCRYSL